VIAAPQLYQLFADPTHDPRVPDLIVQPDHGVIYTTSPKTIAEHGGGTDDDRNVALLVVPGGQRGRPRSILAPVTTTQIAPTILAYLGLNPRALQAVKREHTTRLAQGLLWHRARRRLNDPSKPRRLSSRDERGRSPSERGSQCAYLAPASSPHRSGRLR
jgi:hypothetical protein